MVYIYENLKFNSNHTTGSL